VDLACDQVAAGPIHAGDDDSLVAFSTTVSPSQSPRRVRSSITSGRSSMDRLPRIWPWREGLP
jgi:hypothetical protein